jgi:hypothetical protein
MGQTSAAFSLPVAADPGEIGPNERADRTGGKLSSLAAAQQLDAVVPFKQVEQQARGFTAGRS